MAGNSVYMTTPGQGRAETVPSTDSILAVLARKQAKQVGEGVRNGSLGGVEERTMAESRVVQGDITKREVDAVVNANLDERIDDFALIHSPDVVAEQSLLSLSSR
jgi:hypothetical protein